jgi:hypothetical protein
MSSFGLSPATLVLQCLVGAVLLGVTVAGLMRLRHYPDRLLALIWGGTIILALSIGVFQLFRYDGLNVLSAVIGLGAATVSCRVNRPPAKRIDVP